MRKKKKSLRKFTPDFWLGILFGVLGGAITELWIDRWYRCSELSFKEPTTCSIGIASMIVFLVFVFFCIYQSERSK